MAGQSHAEEKYGGEGKEKKKESRRYFRKVRNGLHTYIVVCGVHVRNYRYIQDQNLIIFHRKQQSNIAPLVLHL